jgi:hypothetical protein
MGLKKEVYNVHNYYSLKILFLLYVLMKLLHIIGDHQILKYDIEEFNFRNYLEDIYETSDLENLHKQSKIYDDFINNKHWIIDENS